MTSCGKAWFYARPAFFLYVTLGQPSAPGIFLSMMTTENPAEATQSPGDPKATWTISGKHPVTGRAIACSDGSWSGDKSLRQAARTLCEAGSFLPLGPYGPMVAADASDPLAVTAVIAALTVGIVGGDVPWERIAAAIGAEED